MAFLALSPSVAASFTRSLAVVAMLQVAAGVFLIWYLVVPLRRAYGGTLAGALAKGVGFALVYSVIIAAAMLGTVIFTAVFV